MAQNKSMSKNDSRKYHSFIQTTEIKVKLLHKYSALCYSNRVISRSIKRIPTRLGEKFNELKIAEVLFLLCNTLLLKSAHIQHMNNIFAIC